MPQATMGSNKHHTLPGKAETQEEIRGKEFLVVGGTKGIGFELVRALIDNGAGCVVAVGRDGELLREKAPQAEFISCDLSLMKNARRLVRENLKGRTFDTVVFTTGIIARPKEIQRTAEGVEEDLAISYLSRFVILRELLEANQLSGRRRVFILGFPGQSKAEPTDNGDDMNFMKSQYGLMPAHTNTIVFNEALVYEAAKRYPDKVNAFGVSPGMIKTDIRDNVHGGKDTWTGWFFETVLGLFTPTAEKYVEKTLLPLVACPALSEERMASTCFRQDGTALPRTSWVASEENCSKAWENSAKLVREVLGE